MSRVDAKAQIGRPVRLLLIATSLSRTSSGGDVFVRGLLRALGSVSADLVVIAPESVATEISPLAPEAEIRPVKDLTGGRRLLRDLFMTEYWARSYEPDFIIYPHEFAPFTSFPVVIVAQNMAPFAEESRRETGLRGGALRLLARLRSHRADVVVAATATAATMFKEHVPGIDQVAVIPPCIEIQEVSIRKEALDHQDPTVLIVLGTWRYKNERIVREALRLIGAESQRWRPRVRIEIAGTALTSRRSYGDVAEPVGWLDRSELLDKMRMSDLVVCPSKVESLGIPAIESVLSGVRPAVMSGSAMSEALGPLAVTFDDAHELADIVLSVEHGTSYRLRDTEVAIPRNTFSSDEVGRQWLEMLSTVTGSEPIEPPDKDRRQS